MSFLFLDFDGVLHPTAASVDRYFCHLELLEAWLRERPGVDIVVASTWREMHPFDELQNHFSPDVQPRVVGVTPLLKRDPWAQFDEEFPPVRFERETEVLRWLAGSGEPWRPWAALDDQPWLFRPLSKNLVVCDGRIGLTKRELEIVDRILCLAANLEPHDGQNAGNAP